ncbi:hypothetical protein OJF2_22290 [Aquisphaera giovannonii]|uniref:Uncharacterized protein n=1 Tax=Aquisphaera giovannonii TaxID=406548 RepID=A0A5B9VZH0_9BACT|nr:hypothetical protein [Aquisphaera giovannonii]QEH33723.1 hypothetical protein OJF2_22290 [Aquisphaera giovannonii]
MAGDRFLSGRRHGHARLSAVLVSLVLASTGFRAASGEVLDEGGRDPLTLATNPGGDVPTGVDLVRLRLFRNEILRWTILADGRNLKRIPQPPAIVVEPPAEAGAAAPAPTPIIPQDDSFDDWAFGGGDGLAKFREQLDRLLESRLREVEAMFALSDAQRRKLRLAGKGDIRRVLDLIEEAREEFDQARVDVRRLAELQRDLKLIELRVSEGLFRDRSLFSKTLRKMFDDRQLTRRPAGSRTIR